MIREAGRTRGRRGPTTPGGTTRRPDYRRIQNTLPNAEIFTEDQVALIHASALNILEDLGVRVLLDEARQRYAEAGARVDEATQMVYLDGALVESALRHAPQVVEVAGQTTDRAITAGGDALIFAPGAGCPNVTDIVHGRRAGTLEDFCRFIQLQQSFDVISILGPSVEPQDVPPGLRHYEMARAQFACSDKVPFVYARGRGQVMDAFELHRLAIGVTEEVFQSKPRTFTVINTNSPRQIDCPMAQGIIDFAEWGQVSIVTPFCLAGAMAPVTVAGALALSHAEALAGITLAQIVRPGAPVVYGAFNSNVDMRSGAPVFGTPAHVQANLGAGQLARYIKLPWRSGAGCASNVPDVQADYETQLSVWGAVLGGANMVLHAAGWLEGGLTISYEKFITDLELLQTLAEIMKPVGCTPDEIGLDAIADVEPGGHFFSTPHTMARYRTQFYAPLVSDWSNYESWAASGGKSATERAREVWQERVQTFKAPHVPSKRLDAMEDFIARRTREGGAAPES